MPMPPAKPFEALMDRLRAGDNEATTKVFNRFAGQVLALARRQLHSAMRSKIDPEDVLQSVFRSFFTRQRDGRFTIENWNSLWGILMVMTLRKCGRRAQYHRAGRRDARREVSWSRKLEDTGDAAVFDREPTPSQAAMLVELVGSLMRSLPEDDREILSLHLQGCTIAEIKALTGRAMRTIRRILERVRRRAREMGETE
jgi:RNA polymerase sigma-70 factor (ECF subfamily)